MDEIPSDLIINFDQTGINYVPISSWTMEKEVAKRVEMVAKDNKRQMTAVFARSLSGDFLPPQLIYEGKGRQHDVFHASNFLLSEMSLIRAVR